jgi:hypothetical protein
MQLRLSSGPGVSGTALFRGSAARVESALADLGVAPKRWLDLQKVKAVKR